AAGDVARRRRGDPRGPAAVEEPEVPVPEVVVEDEALPPRRGDEGCPLAPPQRKRPAGLDGRDDAHQPLRDPLALRHRARQIFRPRAFAEVVVGPPLARRHLARVVLEPVRLSHHASLPVAPIDPAWLQNAGQGGAAEERPVAAEQDPGEAREGAWALGGMLGAELVPARIAHDLQREGNPLADPPGSNPRSTTTSDLSRQQIRRNAWCQRAPDRRA